MLSALLVLAACKGEEAAAEPSASWNDVTSALADTQLRPLELGTVEHYETTRGLSEDVRLLKVRVGERELAPLLASFQVSSKELGKCERKAFPTWSKKPSWKPEGTGEYRCGGGQWSAPGDATPWLVLAFVAKQADKSELLYLALYRGR